jgi:rubrerythrin
MTPDTNVEIIQRNVEVPVAIVKRPKCEKIQYRSFKDAQAVINYAKNHHKYVNGKRINRRMGKKDMRPQRSYRCHICGFWHLTSQPDNNDE